MKFHTLLLIYQARNFRFINPVPRLNKLRHVLIYYQCLLTFSCHELDILIQEDDALLNLRQRDIIPYANRPPINRTIDSLSESDALEFTRFKKNQLQLLLLHLRLPNIVIIGPCRYKFTGEELLIVCLTYIASGMPWTYFIEYKFGGDPRRWSLGYKWFIDHLYFHFYHKISGNSIAHWQHLFHDFRWAILNHLGKPAHQMEVDFDEQLGRPEFIIQAPLESWRVFGFIDDTNVRTCRPGSGPVGNGVGAGRPRRNFADLIQRAFYRYVFCYFYLFF